MTDKKSKYTCNSKTTAETSAKADPSLRSGRQLIYGTTTPFRDDNSVVGFQFMKLWASVLTDAHCFLRVA
jgi:hypothetical protein